MSTTFSYLNTVLLSVLSMGLGLLDWGCSNGHYIAVKNSLDTICIVEVKLKEHYTNESFNKEFGFDSPKEFHSLFNELPSDSTIRGTIWPVINKTAVRFDENTQVAFFQLKPHRQLIVDYRKYAYTNPKLYSLRVLIPSQDQEFFLKGKMLDNTVLENDRRTDDFIIDCN